ncbi:DUF4339 domain-containing protein [Flavobacterium sp.]|uniref:DUF4339 domain-containing protein n=1 Tax=Flavobacterium sp. TaxID=239 RepID=UPI0037533224
MRKYFIHNGETENGPFDIEQLKTMQIKSETPIWYEGLQNWTTGNNVDELKDIINSNSLPPKFENFAQQNSSLNPPIFSKPSQEKIQNDIPEKKKSLRKVYIISGVACALILFLFLNGNIHPNRYPETNNYNGDNIFGIDSSAVYTENDRINDELTAKNRNYRNNIEKYIGASTNRYSYNELGGISNLDIIVTNNTEYLIDEANVNVNYIKDNGGIYKSEIVTIYNIPAKQDKSVSAPESDRGTSVEAKIQTISSKKLHMCYDNTFAPKAGEIDPYFCKQ